MTVANKPSFVPLENCPAGMARLGNRWPGHHMHRVPRKAGSSLIGGQQVGGGVERLGVGLVEAGVRRDDLVERQTVLEVLEENLDRHARSAKDWPATKDFRASNEDVCHGTTLTLIWFWSINNRLPRKCQFLRLIRIGSRGGSGAGTPGPNGAGPNRLRLSQPSDIA
jgi:hypothetical protein